MKKFKRAIFTIPSIFAAGAIMSAPNTQEDSENIADSNGFFNKVKTYVSNIEDNQAFTLAQHSSHSSHSSHGSHGSHGSHSSYNGVNIVDPSASNSFNAKAFRNEDSTPRQTILPSSPAIAEYGSRKLKVLPGNSKRFQETIQKLQIALVSRGFDVGEVNGLLHSRTIAAVYEYQSKNNFIPNGKITPETLSSLGITA
jgi:His-Xaa-Ser repeat protein HxsA